MEGEDEALLPVVENLVAEHRAFVIIAPRKPERFEQVAGLLATSSLRFVRRSSFAPAQADVLLLDGFGELARIYRYATAAFIGGMSYLVTISFSLPGLMSSPPPSPQTTPTTFRAPSGTTT
jgi:3-deoxy-D-manno-octulosonic-acid transferase